MNLKKRQQGFGSAVFCTNLSITIVETPKKNKNNNEVNNNDATSDYEETFVNVLTYFAYCVKLLT